MSECGVDSFRFIAVTLSVATCVGERIKREVRLSKTHRLSTNWPVIFTEDTHTTNQKPSHL